MAVDVKPCFISKIKSVRGRLNHCTLLHRTITKPFRSSTVCILVFSYRCSFLWFQTSNFVGECIDDYGTPVLCDESLRDFRGAVSDLTLLSSCVSTESNSGFSVASSLIRKLIFEIRSLVDVFLN